jgi:hypothetical protein
MPAIRTEITSRRKHTRRTRRGVTSVRKHPMRYHPRDRYGRFRKRRRSLPFRQTQRQSVTVHLAPAEARAIERVERAEQVAVAAPRIPIVSGELVPRVDARVLTEKARVLGEAAKEKAIEGQRAKLLAAADERKAIEAEKQRKVLAAEAEKDRKAKIELEKLRLGAGPAQPKALPTGTYPMMSKHDLDLAETVAADLTGADKEAALHRIMRNGAKAAHQLRQDSELGGHLLDDIRNEEIEGVSGQDKPLGKSWQKKLKVESE